MKVLLGWVIGVFAAFVFNAVFWLVAYNIAGVDTFKNSSASFDYTGFGWVMWVFIVVIDVGIITSLMHAFDDNRY